MGSKYYPPNPVEWHALFPQQRQALEEIERAFNRSRAVALVGREGSGKSAVARALAQRHGGAVLDLADYAPMILAGGFRTADARIVDLIDQTLNRASLLVLDDFAHFFSFDRNFGMSLQTRMLRERVLGENKRLLLVGRDADLSRTRHEGDYDLDTIYGANDTWNGSPAPTPIIDISAEPFGLADFEVIAANLLGEERASAIDWRLVRFNAPQLTLKQLRWLCRLLARQDGPRTSNALAYLERHIVRSPVRTNEVEALDFARLPGTEAIARALETHVVMPFENPARAMELGLKAKRGVLLYGVPGTGKTSIGRALARRLKGRFFLIDGSIGTEPPQGFIERFKHIVDEARDNAPSVVFIDDADELFTIPHVRGLVRYLLSLLDGVEGESSSRVCVMLTAMDAMKVPEALLRSGRIELWLEVALPGEATRARMFERWAGEGLPEGALDIARLARLTQGFTPADIRRVVDDARLLHARDIVGGAATSGPTAYVEHAIADLVAVRADMATTLGDPRLRVGTPLLEMAQ